LVVWPLSSAKVHTLVETLTHRRPLCHRAGQASPSSLSTWTRPQRSRYVPLTASGRPGSAPNACIWRTVSGACAWFGAGPGHVLLRSLAVMNILPAALPLSLRRDLSVTAPPSSMTRYLSSHRGMRQGCEDAALYGGAARGPAFSPVCTHAHTQNAHVFTQVSAYAHNEVGSVILSVRSGFH